VNVEIRALLHCYDRSAQARPAVKVAALSVASGSRLCLVGGSGSGKSTLLHIIAGLVVPTSGAVWLDALDVFSLGEAERDRLRARRIGCVFQTFNLLQGLSALENLTLAQRFAGTPSGPARARALDLLERLGLGSRAAARPSELSVGEQQRVAIARAVSNTPGLVLADEPTASLDDENAAAAIELLLDACRESTLIVATHDPRLASRLSTVRPMRELAEAC
jgi:ABC-type lipoprotein export system ATPase subunit